MIVANSQLFLIWVYLSFCHGFMHPIFRISLRNRITKLKYDRSSLISLKISMSSFVEEPNPLLKEWRTEYGLPPFCEIKSCHFKTAYDCAIKKHLEEIKAIVDNPEEANFQNTIASFDRAGGLIEKIDGVFHNLCSSCNPPELQTVELELAAPLAAHKSAIYMYPGLFDRVEAVHNMRLSLIELNEEQHRLIERTHLDFVRAGSRFNKDVQDRYSDIVQQLASLTTQFTQNVAADEVDFILELSEKDLNGLPSFIKTAAKQSATERGKDDVYVITMSRSLVVPFLTFSDRRDLREQAWRMWTTRGELDPTRDNKAIAIKILELRAEQASMHGYRSYADFVLADTMAGTPEAVMDLLERVWTPAKASADREREALEEYITSLSVSTSAPIGGTEEGDKEVVECPITIQPWDWRYYAEKVRQSKYNIDQSEIKPYFELGRMCEAIFDCANQLFNLHFELCPDLRTYHPDVKVYKVYEYSEEDIDGDDDDSKKKFVGLFLHDNYQRMYKKSGAWMSEFRSQSRNDDENGTHIYPIVINNNNFAKGSDGEATLLSFDDARTLFHEFGHGLHGMLSNVTYKSLAGTNVLRDFVELPSQLYEHWLSQPEVLKKHARHFESNEPIPDDLLSRLMAAEGFNKGFDTVEYTACALIDQSIHKLTATELSTLDISSFENSELQRLGMPNAITLRHRLPHFQHLFASRYYAAAYYVYLWAEVLDADGFEAFLETGNCFDKVTAKRVRQFVYSVGNSLEPRAAYRAFRGREPAVEPMLKKKGLLA